MEKQGGLVTVSCPGEGPKVINMGGSADIYKPGDPITDYTDKQNKSRDDKTERSADPTIFNIVAKDNIDPVKREVFMKTYKLFMLLSCMAVLLAACAPNTVINPTPVSQLDQQARSYAQAPKEYIIEVGDTLDIKFMYNAELNELAVPVRPDGRISLQLAHDVPAAGLTPTQLRNVLNEKYAAELKKPEIAVIVRSFGGQKIFVDGEVNYSGSY